MMIRRHQKLFFESSNFQGQGKKDPATQLAQSLKP